MDDPRRPGLLVSDFDGTVTRHDFFRLAVESFAPGGMEEFWQGYLAGRYTHFEALAGIFGSIRTDEAALLALVARAEPDPDMAGWLIRLRAAGWDVEVASAGCGWYIDRVLAAAGAAVPVHASPGRFDPRRGLIMEMPHGSPYLSPTHGIDKAAVVRAGLARGQAVAFAGDGYSDLPAARLVPERLRFARSDLSDALRRERLGFRPFDRWGEVAAALCAERA
ncbi:MAG: haloacid dehalogenase-like hydrolase [Gemmataceae bacterium]